MDEDRMDQMIEKCKILKKKRAEELKIGVASRRRDGKWYPKGTRPSNTPVKSPGRRKGLRNQRQREFDQGRQEVTVAAPQTATSGLKIRLSAVAIRSALGDDSRESTNTLENKLEDVRGTDLDAGRDEIGGGEERGSDPIAANADDEGPSETDIINPGTPTQNIVPNSVDGAIDNRQEQPSQSPLFTPPNTPDRPRPGPIRTPLFIPETPSRHATPSPVSRRIYSPLGVLQITGSMRDSAAHSVA